MPVPFAFMAGAVGPGEFVLVFAAVLLLFGPKRIPEIARTLGKALSEMRRASREFQDQVMRIEESPVTEDPANFTPRPGLDSELTPPPAESASSGESDENVGPVLSAATENEGADSPTTTHEDELTHATHDKEPADGAPVDPAGRGPSG